MSEDIKADRIWTATVHTMRVGDIATFDGVYDRPVWWKRALMALRLMDRPPLRLREFEITNQISARSPDPSDW